MKIIIWLITIKKFWKQYNFIDFYLSKHHNKYSYITILKNQNYKNLLQCNLQFTTTANEDPPQLTTDFTMHRSFSTQIDLRSTTTLKARPRPLFSWHKYIKNISLFTSNDVRLKIYPIIYS
jgi:hypothetical protein